MVSNQKKVESTSLRSATQATDSTCTGWMPNKAATKALCQRPFVILKRTKKEQDGVGDVKQEVSQMVPCGVQAEDLDVQHVGHPGQGMPVTGIADGESPTQVFNSQAVQHVAVFGYVNMIVEVNEVAPGNLPEGAGDDDRKDDADQ